MDDSLNAVIERCKGQMPDVILGEHYGYYRHDDVARLVEEIENLHLILEQVRTLSLDQTVSQDDALVLIADLAAAR